VVAYSAKKGWNEFIPHIITNTVLIVKIPFFIKRYKTIKVNTKITDREKNRGLRRGKGGRGFFGEGERKKRVLKIEV